MARHNHVCLRRTLRTDYSADLATGTAHNSYRSTPCLWLLCKDRASGSYLKTITQILLLYHIQADLEIPTSLSLSFSWGSHGFMEWLIFGKVRDFTGLRWNPGLNCVWDLCMSTDVVDSIRWRYMYIRSVRYWGN